MDNIFYNVVSFIVGALVIFYTIFNFKEIKLIFKSLLIVYSVMFIGLGIAGFIVPEKYSVFIIIGFLVFAIASVATLVVSNKWKEAEENKKNNKDVL